MKQASNNVRWIGAIIYFVGMIILVVFFQDLPATSAWWAPIFIGPAAIMLRLISSECMSIIYWDSVALKLLEVTILCIGVLGLAYLALFHLTN